MPRMKYYDEEGRVRWEMEDHSAVDISMSLTVITGIVSVATVIVSAIWCFGS